MRIAISCDHAGLSFKQIISETVQAAGHEVVDLGTFGPEAVDYPDFAEKAGLAIQRGEVERAIVVCGSGIGASIAANKIHGVFAGLCHDSYSARQGVEHDDMNMICLGARVIGPEIAKDVVKSFLGATFCHEERHLRRVNKIKMIEKRN